jgi:DNA invertase Pin-like site-specific DNA recombinase
MKGMRKALSRVALYARVSTRDKRQDTENQLAQLRQFAGTQGWKVVHEYVDRATGKHSDREQFQKLFQDASQRKFDVVLFWSLDRFSREGVRETLNHLERLSSYGVGYRSFTEQYLDSCGIFKDAVLSILATIAKQERIRLSERTIAGLEKARKEGRVGGRPKVVVNRTKMERLHRAGKSLSQIATAVRVSKSTVHRLLMEVRKDGHGSDIRAKGERQRGHARARPRARSSEAQRQPGRTRES